MPTTIQVGAILMNDCPVMARLFPFESEPCSGTWNLVKALDGISLDRTIHAAGWNFFFMAAEVKARFFGVLGAAKIQSALRRILGKVKQQQFNSLEVTGIVAGHFLGVPYVTVSAYSRHIQQSCYLDGIESRRIAAHNGESAKA